MFKTFRIKKARQLKFKMWIKHSDGSVVTDSSGKPLQTTQTFDIPVWDDKPNFWPLGALDHIKSDFNSGLKSCSLIYQIPSDAQLKSGDTVAFQVLDENGNVLADDNTETQRYTTVSFSINLRTALKFQTLPAEHLPCHTAQSLI